MPAPIAVALAAAARAGGQAAARGAAVAARTGARAGAKAARTGGRAAVRGARTGARAGGRAATTAGKASSRAGSRGAGRAARSVARGGRHPANRAEQMGRGRPQGRTGRAETGRVGTHGSSARLLSGRAGQPVRGGPQLASRLGQQLRAARTGEAVPRKTALQRAGSAYRVARSLRRGLRLRKRRRKRRRRNPHEKLRERLRKRRRRVVVMLLLALVLALSGLFGAVFFTVAGMSDEAAVSLAAQQQGIRGATLTNAGSMGEAFVAAGVPAEYADDFVATANLGIDPRLVAAVAWQESVRFDEDVIACRRDSPKGAQGIMQFMPGTAAEREADPCRPGEAITAGASYLLEIYERFDRWDLALAGYNAGPNAVAGCNCIPKNGETENYVTAVNGQWEEYKRTVPEPLLSGSGSGVVGASPGVPLGSTERYVEPQITATMQALLDQAVPLFGRGRGIGCYDPSRPSGEHPLGRACDFMMAAGNTHPSPEDLEHGWRFACWMVQNAEVLDVRYVIWQHQIWESRHNSAPDRRCLGGRAGDGWGHYGRYDGCTDRCLQLQHYDHIHVTVN